MQSLRRQFSRMMRRQGFDADLREEMAAHQALKEAEYRDAGLSHQDASAQARRDMGNLTGAVEQSRDHWWFAGVEAIGSDVRLALRVLVRAPLFSACAVLTLALSIGANTAIFSLWNALLIRPLPVPEGDRIVQIVMAGDGPPVTVFSYPIFEQIRDRARLITGLFIWTGTDVSEGQGPQASKVSAFAVGGEAFSSLRLAPQAGRLLQPSDDRPGAPLVTVVSDGYWTQRFARRPGAIGSKLLLGGRPFTIVGVLPPQFPALLPGQRTDLCLSSHANAAIHPEWPILTSKKNFSNLLFARLRPGVTMGQAQAEMRSYSPQFFSELDKIFETFEVAGQRARLRTLELLPGGAGGSILALRYRRSLLLLTALSALVILLACANLAGLALARVAPRQKELAVRMALGSGRRRLIRQLLVESLLLSLAGAALAIPVAFAAARGIVALLASADNTLVMDVFPDSRVLIFAAAIGMAAGLLLGLAPALQGSNLSPADAMKQSKIGLEQSGSRFRLGRLLVSMQVAIAVLLTAGAILMIQTLENLRWQDYGWSRDNLVFVELDGTHAGLKDKSAAQFWADALEQMRGATGVRAASYTNMVPVAGGYSWIDLRPENWPGLTAKQRQLYQHHVYPNYPHALGLRVIAGRDFSPTEPESKSEEPALLSTSAASTYFRGQNAVGQLLRENEKTAYRVIGVVSDAAYADPRETAPRTMYLYDRAPQYTHLVVRGAIDKGAATNLLRRYLESTGRDVRIGDTISLDEQIDRALISERLIATLACCFAVLAVSLAAVGLYGVVGYSVARRRSEIGLRMALGAQPEEVVFYFLRDAAVLVMAGIGIGTMAVLAGGRLLNSVLYQTHAADPLLLAGVAVFSLSVAALASFLPAWRASRIDPLTALRYE